MTRVTPLRASALASAIWYDVRPDPDQVRASHDDAHHLARDIAPFGRCRSCRNSKPRSASSVERTAIEPAAAELSEPSPRGQSDVGAARHFM